MKNMRDGRLTRTCAQARLPHIIARPPASATVTPGVAVSPHRRSRFPRRDGEVGSASGACATACAGQRRHM